MSSKTKSVIESIPFGELLFLYGIHRTLKTTYIRNIALKVSESERILRSMSSLVKLTIYQVFCGGESLTDCIETVGRLEKRGVYSILDYAVEGQADETYFEATFNQLLKTASIFGSYDSVPFLVFKMTALCDKGLLEKISSKKSLTDEERESVRVLWSRLKRICDEASLNNLMVLIDAEESWLQDAIDELTEKLMVEYNRDRCLVFTTIQCYRTDRLEYCKQLVNDLKAAGVYIGVKVVRGAYIEAERNRAAQNNYPDPIHQSIQATHHTYDEMIQYLSTIETASIICATHNQDSCVKLLELMKEDKASGTNLHSRVWFSQLLGMSDNLSYLLADEGVNVAKYVPYGPVEETVPYLNRRVNENSAIRGELGRETKWLREEIVRRLKFF